MTLIKYIVCGISFFLLMGCATNPFTGKKTLAIVPNAQLFPISFQQYKTFLDSSNVVQSGQQLQQIRRVGSKIALAAETYLKYKGFASYTKDYEWAYNLVADSTINAWCMPGGKIVFYEGILPIAKNEDGIAAIMGHEVAHALANHGQQRMSASQLQQFGALAGNIALSKKEENQKIFNTAYGVGTQVGLLLPFSRKHESEADKIGLTLMILAGYNPNEAIKLWQRMKTHANGSSPPEFLSTHPSYDTRIDNIKTWIAEAKREAQEVIIKTQ